MKGITSYLKSIFLFKPEKEKNPFVLDDFENQPLDTENSDDGVAAGDSEDDGKGKQEGEQKKSDRKKE
ncbi:hypothetical protein ODU73_001549 [Thermoclostridium stercorarium]|uniref:hypothetical protein n=1 Tax=Thermoclostridium stercorarium TaxID=1510 RepID=UPI0022492DF4|nr:hypothetical protein [Thermoclostridium stercorarium]UZQ84521.1 hypothetical protein ODU73_001549 [Thermoclostridium stercorarium]